MSAEAEFRRHTTLKALRKTLKIDVPKMHGVGLDGLQPAAIDRWAGADIDAEVRRVQLGLRQGTHRLTNYREALALRGRGREPRVFSIPTLRDRLALSAAKEALRGVYGFSGPEPPQQKMTRVIEAAQSGHFTHYLRMDICEFYPTVRHDPLFVQLRKKVKSEALLRLLERAVRNPTIPFGQRSGGLSPEPDGIPLGLSVSPLLAEVYLRDLDESWVGRGVAYFRYVDDILLLLPRPTSFYSTVAGDLSRLGLSSHALGTPGKSEEGRLDDGGVNFLGYRVERNHVSVGERGIRRIEHQVAALIAQAGAARKRTSGEREVRRLMWRLDLLVGGCLVNGGARGWVRYYNRATDLHLMGRLDGLVATMLRRHKLEATSVKTFSRAYWASRDNDKFVAYAYNLDIATPGEARGHLRDLEGWQDRVLAEMDDENVLSVFRRLIERQVLDMERDLEPAS